MVAVVAVSVTASVVPELMAAAESVVEVSLVVVEVVVPVVDVVVPVVEVVVELTTGVALVLPPPREVMKDTTSLKVGSEEGVTTCPALLLVKTTGDVNFAACCVVIEFVMTVSCTPIQTRAGMLLNGDCALILARSPW